MINKISGFPEYEPEEQILFSDIINNIKKTFELHGFCPLDTPAVERVSTLIAKGNDNEIYGLHRLTDPTDIKDFALRFDLTVPLARYVAQHAGKIVFPYKRYQISPVWRGERAQAGRYRQFYQCDIDIINPEKVSMNYDAEVVSIARDILKSFSLNFEIKINNRKILEGFLTEIIGDQLELNEVLRIIDKKDKISQAEMETEFQKYGTSQDQTRSILEFLEIKGENNEILSQLKNMNINQMFAAGVEELEKLWNTLSLFANKTEHINISLDLARGLTYYTGSIFEGKVIGANFSSSILGGGRYENLTELFSKEKYPGVGISIGISRLIPLIIEKGNYQTKNSLKVVVTRQEKDEIKSYINIANKLREKEINTEVFLEDKPLKTQIAYADKKNAEYIVIANKDELESQIMNLKHLATGTQITGTLEEILKIITNGL